MRTILLILAMNLSSVLATASADESKIQPRVPNVAKAPLLTPLVAMRAADAPPSAGKPNIILLLSDDLGPRDVGCFGQQVLRTPRLDRMAKEGTRFPQLYCGTSICAPSRTSLMTGLHCGHTPVRGNREIQPEGQMPLPAGTITVAQILKQAGYATACTGKWGMGMFDTTGSPLKLGFDHFYGYNCQRHAHNYFPKYLYSDGRRIELDGKTYAQNLIAAETLAWVRQQKDRPFFLYYAVTLPHGNYEIDSLGQFADKPWPATEKAYAAMVSRLDTDVGRLLDLLKELGIDERTIVIFSGDNGNTFNTSENKAGQRFPSTGDKLRGGKGTMYEGGLRQAGIVRWPGHVPAGRVSQEPWAFWDFLPTAADLAAPSCPTLASRTDGRSFPCCWAERFHRVRISIGSCMRGCQSKPCVLTTGRPCATSRVARSSCMICGPTSVKPRTSPRPNPTLSPRRIP